MMYRYGGVDFTYDGLETAIVDEASTLDGFDEETFEFGDWLTDAIGTGHVETLGEVDD
ncbi:hypothetical protein KHO57_gp230 [Mycobacterium phage Phabba]|uniref:Uncharacterized protein n=1 Tax=Mycobacterium phage Phabba TaxID=2027899 RepID=A0A249XTY7_9CAUD|nr:hypothetical protein KHO57_gp230 [Mycobacterium phage Phabba]ASZ74674.1 hypothetical protein SEA_PHABBA_105 [Mycobacterium phage Phabba]